VKDLPDQTLSVSYDPDVVTWSERSLVHLHVWPFIVAQLRSQRVSFSHHSSFIF